MMRFKLDWAKALEAIDLIAEIRPGITQYYVGKVLFFADREHFLDYGRPITGDKYVAMEHGPVPSFVRDILKSDSDSPDEIIQAFHDRLIVERINNLQKLHSKGVAREQLSGSDISYITESVAEHGSMPFEDLKKKSHQDPAYEAAWLKDGFNNEMDIGLWLASLEEADAALNQTREYVAVGC